MTVIFGRIVAASRVAVCHQLAIFFLQAEDGIRDLTVTGVQTCALPIFPPRLRHVTAAGGGGTACSDRRNAWNRIRNRRSVESEKNRGDGRRAGRWENGHCGGRGRAIRTSVAYLLSTCRF